MHRSMSGIHVSELMNALVNTSLPLVRKMISKKFIHQGLIVKDEKPVEVFDPNVGKWVSGPSMPGSRGRHCVCTRPW